jgi:hypothetical protein
LEVGARARRVDEDVAAVEETVEKAVGYLDTASVEEELETVICSCFSSEESGER